MRAAEPSWLDTWAWQVGEVPHTGRAVPGDWQEAMKELGQATAAQIRCPLRAGRKMCCRIGGTQHPGFAFTEMEREEDLERVSDLPNVAQQKSQEA